jgi:hypothetical protein
MDDATESGSGSGSGNRQVGMRGRYGGRQSNSCLHVFVRVSGCVAHHMCVCLLVAQDQSVLVLGHCLVTISLIPLKCDLIVSIVPLAFCWCLPFASTKSTFSFNRMCSNLPSVK